MAVRTVTAVAVLTAAAVAVAAVCVVRRDRRLRRRLCRQQAASRLTEGTLHRDLAAFRRRVDAALAQGAVVQAAGLVVDDALTTHTRIDPYSEGGPA